MLIATSSCEFVRVQNDTGKAFYMGFGGVCKKLSEPPAALPGTTPLVDFVQHYRHLMYIPVGLATLIFFGFICCLSSTSVRKGTRLVFALLTLSNQIAALACATVILKAAFGSQGLCSTVDGTCRICETGILCMGLVIGFLSLVLMDYLCLIGQMMCRVVNPGAFENDGTNLLSRSERSSEVSTFSKNSLPMNSVESTRWSLHPQHKIRRKHVQRSVEVGSLS